MAHCRSDPEYIFRSCQDAIRAATNPARLEAASRYADLFLAWCKRHKYKSNSYKAVLDFLRDARKKQLKYS